MARRKHPRSRVVGSFVRIPEPLPAGKVRCAGCSAVVSLNKSGKMRAHQSPSGEPCAYSVSYSKVHLEEIPPVVLPPAPAYHPPREPKPKPPKPPSRLEAGSECVDCGKWLPGERSVCGKCSIKRNRSRRGT